MDIFFQDPSEVPLPLEEVRIRELRAEPWPDGRRVLVYLEVDPFQQRPSADIVITNADGDQVADASIIGSMTRKIEINLHLRHPETEGEYTLSTVLFYSDPLPEPQEGETEPPKLPDTHIIDRAETKFAIPKA